MNQKYKSIIAIVLAVWLFGMGFVVGKDAGMKSAPASSTQQVTEEAQIAEKPTKPNLGGSTDNGTNNGGATNNGGTTDNGGSTNNGGSTAVDPTQYSKDQIIQMMNYYVNLVKSESNMTATKTEVIKVTVTDCSVPALVNTINGIVSGVIGDESESVTYSFVNDKEAGGGTPFSLIPPTNKQFVVTADGVASASVTKDENGNYVYTVVLVPETTTMASPEPKYNATAIGYLDLAGIDVSPAKIEQADMTYPGSTVSITVDANDRVVKLYNKLPMSGVGKAKLGLSGEASFEGALDETWVFSY